MTDRPDLDAIEALLTAATPGPWLIETAATPAGERPWGEVVIRHHPAGGAGTPLPGIRLTWQDRPGHANARLIAAAPLALREVIAYARALEQERDEVQARHDAEIAGIVDALHAYAEDHTDDSLHDLADSIATTHAAALARHAGRAGGANG